MKTVLDAVLPKGANAGCPAAPAPGKLHDLDGPAVSDFRIAEQRFELVARAGDVALVPEGPPAHAARLAALDALQELERAIVLEPRQSDPRREQTYLRLASRRTKSVLDRRVSVIEIPRPVTFEAAIIPALGVGGPVGARPGAGATGQEPAGQSENEGS